MGEFYGSLDIHRLMLRDDVRNQAYRQAILATVKSGDVVLDFGAGTGILSLFAAQAGAKKVYAVERTSIAAFTRKMVAKNGFQDRIEVIHGDMQAIRLPQKVDVIVSEWLGTYGVDENLLAPLLLARDRWLKPGGKMLPERVTAWMAPIWSSELDGDLNFWKSRPYGLDLSLLDDGAIPHLTWSRQPITADHLLAEPQPMWTTDVYHDSAEKAQLPFRASLRFTVTREGKLNALSAWFHAEFGSGITLTNAPDAPRTHWAQYIFPLRNALEVGPGMLIRVEFTCIPAMPGYCHQAWSVRIGDRAWEHHDTRQNAWAR